MRIFTSMAILVCLVALFGATGIRSVVLASPVPPCPSVSQLADCPAIEARPSLPGRGGVADSCSLLLCPEAGAAGAQMPVAAMGEAPSRGAEPPAGPVYGIDKPPKG